MNLASKEEVSINDFMKLNLALGTVLEVEHNTKAKKPAYILKIDFGKKIGIKFTSAQITNYSIEQLIGRQVVGICNLPSKKVAGFKSEVLILGAITGDEVHLLRSDTDLENGTIIG